MADRTNVRWIAYRHALQLRRLDGKQLEVVIATIFTRTPQPVNDGCLATQLVLGRSDFPSRSHPATHHGNEGDQDYNVRRRVADPGVNRRAERSRQWGIEHALGSQRQ